MKIESDNQVIVIKHNKTPPPESIIKSKVYLFHMGLMRSYDLSKWVIKHHCLVEAACLYNELFKVNKVEFLSIGNEVKNEGR